MIKTTDLKLQMDELTKQNDMVLIELEQVKKMLLGQGQQQSGQSQQQGGQGQQQSGQSQQQGGQGHQQSGQSQQQSSQQGGQQSNTQVADLANDLLQIKDMVEKLEKKTSQYVSSQSSGTLTEKDAVSLVLTLMNGMVDWASEFVAQKSSGTQQLQ